MNGLKAARNAIFSRRLRAKIVTGRKISAKNAKKSKKISDLRKKIVKITTEPPINDQKSVEADKKSRTMTENTHNKTKIVMKKFGEVLMRGSREQKLCSHKLSQKKKY